MQARQGVSLSDVIERITPEAIACHLYAANLPDPDLIIRTSGEIRLSGFLLWQSVHSEFYFTDVLWPAFRKVDFLRAIRAYQTASVPIKYQGLGTKYTHRARRLLASGSPVLFAGGIALAGLAISSLTKGTTLNPVIVWALLLVVREELGFRSI
jgi:hypothetical protein